MSKNNNYKYLTTIKTILAGGGLSPQAVERYSKELNGVYQMAEEYADRLERDDIGGRLRELDHIKSLVTAHMNEELTNYTKEELVEDLIDLVGVKE